VLAFVALVPETIELFEVVLDQTVQRGGLGIPGPIDSLGQALHIGSNRPAAPAANKILANFQYLRLTLAKALQRNRAAERGRETDE
jgi:hypothetical protein